MTEPTINSNDALVTQRNPLAITLATVPCPMIQIVNNLASSEGKLIYSDPINRVNKICLCGKLETIICVHLISFSVQFYTKSKILNRLNNTVLGK